jgi:hypothetical protein
MSTISYSLNEAIERRFTEAFLRDMLEGSKHLPQALQDIHAEIKAMKKHPNSTYRRNLHRQALVLAKKHGLDSLAHFHRETRKALKRDSDNKPKRKLYAKVASGKSLPVKLGKSRLDAEPLMHAHEGIQVVRPTQSVSASSIGAWTRLEGLRDAILNLAPVPPGVRDVARAVDGVKQGIKKKIGDAAKKTGISKVIPPGVEWVAGMV